MAEAQEFVDHLYGRDNIVSDRHFTVREDTEVADNFVCNNNSDCKDVKLEPYEIYDQVNCVSLTDLKCVDFLVRNLYHYLSSSCGNSLEFVTIVWCVQ